MKPQTITSLERKQLINPAGKHAVQPWYRKACYSSSKCYCSRHNAIERLRTTIQSGSQLNFEAFKEIITEEK